MIKLSEREQERERESFIRNNVHNGVVSGVFVSTPVWQPLHTCRVCWLLSEAGSCFGLRVYGLGLGFRISGVGCRDEERTGEGAYCCTRNDIL